MKSFLSVLRILIGVFGGISIILLTLSVIFSLTYEPKPFQGSGVFPDMSGLHIVITGLGAYWSGVITLFLIVFYLILKLILKYFFKNKTVVK